jgi:hypothetical protein
MAAMLMLGTGMPQAATLTVLNNNDSGAGSLRATVAAASAGDTIVFGSVTGTITLTSGAIAISQNLTITGPGAGTLTVSGNNASQVFNLTNVTGTISGLTISGGNIVGFGGGIATSGGALTLSNVVVTGNTATNGGGGIINGSVMILINTTVSGNSASFGGGFNNLGPLTLTNSTVSGNAATAAIGADGGGIYTDATVSLIDSTVSGNTATNGGGIFVNGAATTVNNATIANNGGSQFFVNNINGAAATLESTVIANPAGGTNCGGPVLPTSNGFNLDSANSCAFAAPTDLINTNPLLGPLANNGGPTLTLALLAGSPAINKGANPLALAFDQRGPGFARVSGGATDIGAFEVQAAQSLPIPTPALNAGALLALAALSALAGMAALRRQRDHS